MSRLTWQAVHDPFRPFVKPSGPLLFFLCGIKSSIFYHAGQSIHDRHCVDVLGRSLALGLFVSGIVPTLERFDGVRGGFLGRGDGSVLKKTLKNEYL